jgi:hypothetical protein
MNAYIIKITYNMHKYFAIIDVFVNFHNFKLNSRTISDRHARKLSSQVLQNIIKEHNVLFRFETSI